MRNLRFAFLAMLAALAAVAMTGGATRAQASCVYVIVWHDTAYFGFYSLEQLPGTRAGMPIDGAITPDCADTGGPPGSPTDAKASRIQGLSPDVAIVSGGTTLVAEGYLPQLRSFPLRRRDSASPDETRNCTTGPPVVINGTADGALFGLSVRRASGGVVSNLFIDSHTRVVGLRRHGLPFIGDGQRVRLVAVPCQVKGANGPKLVVRRITAAGPIVGQASAKRVLGKDWDGVSTPVTHSSTFWVAALPAAAAAGGWLRHRRLG